MTKLTERLADIQSKLNAPKNQFNKFGGYKYRSCEDILMALKPLMKGLALTINDEMVAVGDRIYVKATATITDGETFLSATAYAREAETKKGMDESQITGSTSSYARKYALNGLFMIDDNKDADHGAEHEPEPAPKPLDLGKAIKAILESESMDDAQRFTKSALARASNDEQRGRINNALEQRREAA